MKGILEEKVRAHLGRFGFPQQKADTQIAKLSGGEKARLLFALMTREAPHILMLDEPTNHLDIDSREALIQAINGYEGAVILISHDPHLIELTADRLLLVDDGACRAFDGDLDDYRKLLLEKRRAERSDKTERESGLSKKDQRRAAAELRAALAPLKRKVDNAEKLIARLTRERQALEIKIADPELYNGPADNVTKLQKDLGDIQKKLSAAEETWMEAHEALEAAESEAASAA
jgi:ATP-binding cassette subfamily F protein 3